MGVCWYCYWGWAKPVRTIYNAAAKIVGEDALTCGPGHIVWSDENFGNDSIKFCLECCDKKTYCEDWHEETLAVVRKSLVDLLAIPEEVRDCCPSDYDDEHPENYPPTIEMEK